MEFNKQDLQNLVVVLTSSELKISAHEAEAIVQLRLKVQAQLRKLIEAEEAAKKAPAGLKPVEATPNVSE